MRVKQIETHAFRDAHELLDRLAEVLKHYGGVLNVEGPNGEEFSRFSIQELTLSDGSVVHELVIHEEGLR